MATHSSILSWRVLWTEEPGGPQSMGLQSVKHDWATNTLIAEVDVVVPNRAGTQVHGFQVHSGATQPYTYTCIHSPPDSPPIQAATQH